jgi:serine/threonine-protein kinase
MKITSGARLGSYEILSPLGAGGMGEVWKARDTKLRREVAIKTLPDALARDADRLARLEREAELLASLNHPNIATIYGVECTPDGSLVSFGADRSVRTWDLKSGKASAQIAVRRRHAPA